MEALPTRQWEQLVDIMVDCASRAFEFTLREALSRPSEHGNNLEAVLRHVTSWTCGDLCGGDTWNTLLAQMREAYEAAGLDTHEPADDAGDQGTATRTSLAAALREVADRLTD